MKPNCCEKFRVTTGAIVFGILDFVWSGVKLCCGYFVMVNPILSSVNDYLVGFFFIDAALSIVFASLLVYGVRKRRYQLLLSFIVWQLIRITVYSTICAFQIYSAIVTHIHTNVDGMLNWMPAATVAMIVCLMISGMCVVRDACRYLQEQEGTTTAATPMIAEFFEHNIF